MSVSADRWTCPTCLRTYHSPESWEVPIWMAARRAAQIHHANRHGHGALFERRRRRDDPDPEGAP